MPIIVAVLGVIIVVMGAVLYFMPEEQVKVAVVPVTTETVKKTESMEQVEEAVVNNDIPPAPGTIIETVVLNGEGNYLTPARTPHKVTVELTMVGDVIADVNVLYNDLETYSDPNQERFDNTYKPLVVGKKMSELSLSRVGGASLTTNAFNEAVAKIAAEQA